MKNGFFFSSTLMRSFHFFVFGTVLFCASIIYLQILANLPSQQAYAASPQTYNNLTPPPLSAKVSNDLIYNSVSSGPYFDLPVTYNAKVRSWINFFQSNGKRDFKIWLERSARYLPKIIPVLEAQGLPKDLAYLAMIESGFSHSAVSSAAAVGYWQFIKPTANRYGLKTDWWIDERRDIIKSTIAAANYLNDLYKMFNSWYLAAAAYNMGEGRVKGLIKRHQTNNYWVLSKQRDFPQETEQYIPKLIAAMLIAKTPKLYGFRDLKPHSPMQYEYFQAPGGTDLENLAMYLGFDSKVIVKLNPEITQGFIPMHVTSHKIRLPPGRIAKAKQFASSSLVLSN